MLNSIKLEELKKFLRLPGLKVAGKKNLSSKNILCYWKQFSLSEDNKRSQS